MLTIPCNDYGFVLKFTCTQADGSAFDLTGYTIYFVMWSPGKPYVKLVDGLCTDPLPTTGVCYYITQLGDFPSIGNFNGEIQITKTGAMETFGTLPVKIVESA